MVELSCSTSTSAAEAAREAARPAPWPSVLRPAGLPELASPASRGLTQMAVVLIPPAMAKAAKL